MLTIALEQVRFRAFHGFYPEEQVIGNDFIVDVYVTIPGITPVDDLSDTVNYQELFDVVKTVMAVPQPLLEQVVTDISTTIRERYPRVKKTVVTLRKLSPPMEADVRNSMVSLEKDYI
jgi:dihydroneopterin aldolase